MITRREYLKRSAAVALLSGLGHDTLSGLPRPTLTLRVSACDWSIGKSSDPEAFDVAKQIGLEGVQVNMGSEKNNLHLRDSVVQEAYRNAMKRTGLPISSFALGEFNNVPFKSEPRTEQWLTDTIDLAASFNVKTILLAFFNKNDLRGDSVGKEETIRRLKIAAPRAEKMGVILGIESYLSAAEHQEIIQRVGSANVKVYMDFRNTADAGYDVINELKQLSPGSICELHIKENRQLLGNGTLDWYKIGETLAGMGYTGEDNWIQIEGSLPEKTDVVQSYKHNLQYIKKAFSLK